MHLLNSYFFIVNSKKIWIESLFEDLQNVDILDQKVDNEI